MFCLNYKTYIFPPNLLIFNSPENSQIPKRCGGQGRLKGKVSSFCSVILAQSQLYPTFFTFSIIKKKSCLYLTASGGYSNVYLLFKKG